MFLSLRSIWEGKVYGKKKVLRKSGVSHHSQTLLIRAETFARDNAKGKFYRGGTLKYTGLEG